jgi:hypothetical protein
LIWQLILRLMAEGALADIADPTEIESGRRVAELDQLELKALIFQLGVLRSGVVVTNWVEYARGSELEPLFRAVEQDLINFSALGLDELRPEFSDFWTRLKGELDKRLKLLELQDKSTVKI